MRTGIFLGGTKWKRLRSTVGVLSWLFIVYNPPETIVTKEFRRRVIDADLECS